MPSEHGTGGGRGADRWVGFADWLRWHAGGSVGEATAADQDEPQGQQQSVPAGAPPLEVPEAGSSAAQATVPAAPENPTEGFRLDTREIPNCRHQEHMISNGARIRQQAAVQLQLPGMAGRVTSSLSVDEILRLDAVLCKPLVELKVGGLGRKILPDPKFLQPTGDKGILALWLLPDSRLRLLWQPEPRDVLASGPTGGRTVPAAAATTGGVLPQPHPVGVLAFTEDLARVRGVPSLQHLPDPADVAVCLLPSDRSGRSFSIRSTEAAASARPGINVHPASSNQAVTHLQAASYFYLRDRDLQQPKAQLQRLSALLKYGTTLAAEADIPAAKMAELEAGFASSREGGLTDPASASIPALSSARPGASINEQALGPPLDSESYLAPPPGSLVGTQRLRQAQRERGGVAAALTGGTPCQIHNLTVVAVSALRDTLTGIACDTVACGTVTFPIPAAAELAESPAPWSLPARMQATASRATQAEVVRVGHQRLLTAVLEHFLIQRNSRAPVQLPPALGVTAESAKYGMEEAQEEIDLRAGDQSLQQQRRRRQQRLLAAAQAAVLSAGHVAGHATGEVQSPHAQLARPRERQSTWQVAPPAATVTSGGLVFRQRPPSQVAAAQAEASGAPAPPRGGLSLAAANGGLPRTQRTPRGADAGVILPCGDLDHADAKSQGICENETHASPARRVIRGAALRSTASAALESLVVMVDELEPGVKSKPLGKHTSTMAPCTQLFLPRPPPGKAGRRISCWKSSFDAQSPTPFEASRLNTVWQATEEKGIGHCRNDGTGGRSGLSVTNSMSSWFGSASRGDAAGGEQDRESQAVSGGKQGRRIGLQQLETLLREQQTAVNPDEAE